MTERKRAAISFLIVFFAFVGLLFAPVPAEPTPVKEKTFTASENVDDNWEYLYRATVERVVDGDTVDVTLYLGLSISMKTRLRLYGINAPEVTGEEKEAGKAATEYLKNLIAGEDIIVKTHGDKKGKYGRYLGTIYLKARNAVSVNEMMVRDGHAVEYMK